MDASPECLHEIGKVVRNVYRVSSRMFFLCSNYVLSLQFVRPPKRVIIKLKKKTTIYCDCTACIYNAFVQTCPLIRSLALSNCSANDYVYHICLVVSFLPSTLSSLLGSALSPVKFLYSLYHMYVSDTYFSSLLSIVFLENNIA